MYTTASLGVFSDSNGTSDRLADMGISVSLPLRSQSRLAVGILWIPTHGPCALIDRCHPKVNQGCKDSGASSGIAQHHQRASISGPRPVAGRPVAGLPPVAVEPCGWAACGWTPSLALLRTPAAAPEDSHSCFADFLRRRPLSTPDHQVLVEPFSTNAHRGNETILRARRLRPFPPGQPSLH